MYIAALLIHEEQCRVQTFFLLLSFRSCPSFMSRPFSVSSPDKLSPVHFPPHSTNIQFETTTKIKNIKTRIRREIIYAMTPALHFHTPTPRLSLMMTSTTGKSDSHSRGNPAMDVLTSPVSYAWRVCPSRPHTHSANDHSDHLDHPSSPFLRTCSCGLRIPWVLILIINSLSSTVPSAPPVGVECSGGAGGSSLVVRWAPPSPAHHNGLLQSYRLTLTRLDDSTGEWRSERVEEWTRDK